MDKVVKAIEKLAKKGNNSYQLPKPVDDDTYNFSYSGLKSSVINLVHNEIQRGNEINKADLACSFQTVAVDEVARKVDKALRETNVKYMVIAGGVSANQYLRDEIQQVCAKYNVKLERAKADA